MAHQFFKTIQYPYQVAVEAVNLAEAYFELGNQEQAEYYALEAVDIEERQTTPYAFYNLGRVEHQRGNVATAKSYFTQSMRSAEMNEDLYMHAYALRELGKVFLEEEDQSEGQQIVTQALQSFQQLGMENEVQETEKILDTT